jgi:uncharacterized protein (TIGR01777 family)
MKVVIAGGTGFIGQQLTVALKMAGHQVVLLSRQEQPGIAVPTVTWQTLAAQPNVLGAVDAIVNLAGETINQRWTPQAKQRILGSRVKATRAIADWVAAMDAKPSVVVNGSAIGFYGNSQTATFTETSLPEQPDNFLAQTGALWEAEADRISGIRVVKLRTGVVLGLAGGALAKMVLPYRMFAGGPIGTGRQWLSWIHIHDLVRLILFAIETPTVSGPLNGTAPTPVTNDTFGRNVGHVLRRPHWLPVPAFAFKLLFGEMASLLLEGQRVLPEKALQAGFQFDFPTAEAALRELFD